MTKSIFTAIQGAREEDYRFFELGIGLLQTGLKQEGHKDTPHS
jgi:hypothetical protein